MAKIMFKMDGAFAHGGRDGVMTAPRSTLPRVAALQVLTGAVAGKQLIITKILTTIGKPDEQVALVIRGEQGYFLSHLEGKACPVVNGRSIAEGARHLLQHGDVLEVTGAQIRFLFN